MLLINLDNSSKPTTMTVPGAIETTSWTLTPGAGGPFGASARLNGVDLQTSLSTGKPISAVPVPGATNSGDQLSLPPLSVSFVIVETAGGEDDPCASSSETMPSHIEPSISPPVTQSKFTSSSSASDCAASDNLLISLRDVLCKSLAMQCGTVHPAPNTTTQGDWPSQAVYMNDLLMALAAVPTAYSANCLQTPTAVDVIKWLADTSTSTPWWNTWVVFQVQYYDMPRKPGDRIESPATLGRKCWAFSYLDSMWARLKPALVDAMVHAPHGVTLGNFFETWEGAVAETMPLCRRAMANCFVNSSYDPSARNGTCPDEVGAFYVGWQWENGGGGREPNAPRPEIAYPFPLYAQTAEFRQNVNFAVATALNEII